MMNVFVRHDRRVEPEWNGQHGQHGLAGTWIPEMLAVMLGIALFWMVR